MCDPEHRTSDWLAHIRYLLVGCFFGACTLPLAGCGRPSYQLETAPVSGTVTLDGQPLPSGYVFIATARGRQASGLIQPDGSFVLSTYYDGDGVQVGTHPVIVTPVPPDEAAGKRVPIPSRYTRTGTSGLTVEVRPGEDNVLELKLSSKK